MYLFAFQIDQKGTYICIFWCTYNKDNKCRGTVISSAQDDIAGLVHDRKRNLPECTEESERPLLSTLTSGPYLINVECPPTKGFVLHSRI